MMPDETKSMSACGGVCGSEPVEATQSKGLSRRALLTSLAAGLATIGLSALGESAAYAAKTYTVCKTSAIKVGSGKVFRPAGASISVLVTQPKKGVWRAFNANCSHQNLPVAGAINNVAICNQHGSQFNADTGAVIAGPAPSRLTKLKVSISGTSVKVTF
ncbi:MAG: hypothetical protein RLZ28_654 [Actinomycetota bacterium]|jgi:nitrite reductase/ring-hydroxylating ferredoxin subunit